MRLKSLFYILFIFTTATFAAAGGQEGEVTADDKEDGGGVEEPGCSSNTNPPCETEGDTLGNGGTADMVYPCVYSQDLGSNALAQYMDCLRSTLPHGFVDSSDVSGLEDTPTIAVVDEDGNAPETLCFYEASRDIQSTSLSLYSLGLEGKIRKFTEDPAGGGQIIVTLNNWTFSFETDNSLDSAKLNRAIAKRIGEHFVIEDEGAYWRIPWEFGVKPITKIGVKSTDDNIFRSGIAIMPHYLGIEGHLCAD